MEETSSKEEKRETRNGTETSSVVTLCLVNPCFLFQQGIRALLKCLGFDDSSSASNTDPPTQTIQDDPPTSTSVVESARASRKPNPRPPINPGSPPQTN